jgi:hypothetical protein
VTNKIQKIWENYVFFEKTIAKQKKQFAKLSKPKKKPLEKNPPKCFFCGEKRHKVSPYFKGKNKFRILLLIFGLPPETEH